jgi:hypothetical protein
MNDRPNDPRHLPFLRDLASQDWPAWEATKGIFADFLEEVCGDPLRASTLRLLEPEVWVGSGRLTIRRDGYRYGYSEDFFKGTLAINPGCRARLFRHFSPIYRVLVNYLPSRHEDIDSSSGMGVKFTPELWLVCQQVFDPPIDCRWGIARESWQDLMRHKFKNLQDARACAKTMVNSFPPGLYELVEKLD